MNDKLSRIKVALTSNNKTRFYGFYLSYFSFEKSEVTEKFKISAKDREVIVLYSEKFVEDSEDGIIGYYLMHITMHLLANHPKRSKTLSDKNLSHLSQDCIIKHLLDKKDLSEEPLILGLLKNPEHDPEFLSLYDKFLSNFLNDDGNDLIFEDLYYWFKENLSEEEKDGLDGVMLDDLPEEDMTEMEFMVLDRLSEKITADYTKSRGSISWDISETLGVLKKTPNDPLDKLIQNAMFKNFGGGESFRTFTKPNRRGYEGYKGKKNKKKILNVVLDTSGSMNGCMEIVLSYAAQDGYLFNLFQIDSEIKEENIMTDITADELSNLRVFGGGGTVLMPAISYICENEDFSDNPTVILTDGYTDKLDFQNMKYPPLVITCGVMPKIIGNHDFLYVNK